jgi:ribosomal protein S18 acetylase RimI-like enzyme
VSYDDFCAGVDLLFRKEDFMQIKKAITTDAVTISEIHALSWKAAYQGIVPQQYLDKLKEGFWVSAFESWIPSGAVIAEILYADEAPVGCVAYGKSRDKKLPDSGEIVSLYVLPAYFRRGYGKILLRHALSALKEFGFSSVYLWVLDENARARRFYEKNGFICTQDDCFVEIMQRQLTERRYRYDLTADSAKTQDI